jgi:sugar phosphate isomerase/epimerase
VESGLGRREWLKAAGAVALGCAVQPAMASHLRTKARKNFRLGIDSNVYAHLPLEEAARRIQADGFRSVLTGYRFADVKFDPLAPDWKAAEKIVATLAKHEITIAAMFGYYNLLDPDVPRRQRSEARMESLLTNWKRLGCPVVSTETGTLNTKSEWLESPDNQTEDAYQKCLAVLQRWSRLAEKTGAVLTIEAYWRNVIGSIDRAERVLREVNSPSLKLVMDPCNYFRQEDLPQMQPMLKDMFRRLGPQIALAHAKDVKAAPNGPEHPAAGRGQLDYPLYLRLLAELDRPLDVIIEHLTFSDVARARDFVLGHVDKLP